MAAHNLATQTRMTFEEFLDWAEANPGFFEFHGGEIVAMAGPSRDHQEIVTSLLLSIGTHLGRHAPCRVFTSGLAVRVESVDKALYPDVLVTCDPRDRADRRAVRHPTLIIEVLSESTRDYDQGDKFRSYKHLESLREYVLVDTAEQSVTLHRRADERKWVSDEALPGESFTLETLGLVIAVSELYGETDVPLPRPRPRQLREPG